MKKCFKLMINEQKCMPQKMTISHNKWLSGCLKKSPKQKTDPQKNQK